MTLSYRAKDRLAVVGGLLAILLILALIVGGIWLRFAAPCKYVDWMPVHEVPARCLNLGGVR